MELGQCVRGPWEDGARRWLLRGTAEIDDQEFDRIRQCQVCVNDAEWCGVAARCLLLIEFDDQVFETDGDDAIRFWVMLVEFDREYQGLAFLKDFAALLGIPARIEDLPPHILPCRLPAPAYGDFS